MPSYGSECALIVGAWDPIWFPHTPDFFSEVVKLIAPQDLIAAVLWPPPGAILRGALEMPIIHSFKLREAVLRECGVKQVVKTTLQPEELKSGIEPFLKSFCKRFKVNTLLVGAGQSLGPLSTGNKAAIEEACRRLLIDVRWLPIAHTFQDSFGVRSCFRAGKMESVRSKTGAWPTYHTDDVVELMPFIPTGVFRGFASKTWRDAMRLNAPLTAELNFADYAVTNDCEYLMITGRD